MGSSNYVHLEGCDVIKETDSAFLIRYDDEQHWIPKSHIADWQTYDEGDEDVTISISGWIANQKGIEVE